MINQLITRLTGATMDRWKPTSLVVSLIPMPPWARMRLPSLVTTSDGSISDLIQRVPVWSSRFSIGDRWLGIPNFSVGDNSSIANANRNDNDINTDVAVAVAVTTISCTSMFDRCINLSNTNNHLSKWKMNKVNNTSRMFRNCHLFNPSDLSDWDTQNVTDMSGMFQNATVFNGDTSKWNTAKVTKMSHLFDNASAFNRDISKWETSKVIDMHSLFANASSFNGDISKWNTSKVTDMSHLFRSSQFNGDISKWDTSKVTNMHELFCIFLSMAASLDGIRLVSPI